MHRLDVSPKVRPCTCCDPRMFPVYPGKNALVCSSGYPLFALYTVPGAGLGASLPRKSYRCKRINVIITNLCSGDTTNNLSSRKRTCLYEGAERSVGLVDDRLETRVGVSIPSLVLIEILHVGIQIDQEREMYGRTA